MYRALIMSPMRIKNNSVTGAHNNRNVSPLFCADRMSFLAESVKRTSIAIPEDASTAIQIGYTRAGQGAYIAASARNVTTGETRLPTAIHGKTVTPPRNVSVPRKFIRTEPCDVK